MPSTGRRSSPPPVRPAEHRPRICAPGGFRIPRRPTQMRAGLGAPREGGPPRRTRAWGRRRIGVRGRCRGARAGRCRRHPVRRAAAGVTPFRSGAGRRRHRVWERPWVAVLLPERSRNFSLLVTDTTFPGCAAAPWRVARRAAGAPCVHVRRSGQRQPPGTRHRPFLELCFISGELASSDQTVCWWGGVDFASRHAYTSGPAQHVPFGVHQTLGPAPGLLERFGGTHRQVKKPTYHLYAFVARTGEEVLARGADRSGRGGAGSRTAAQADHDVGAGRIPGGIDAALWFPIIPVARYFNLCSRYRIQNTRSHPARTAEHRRVAPPQPPSRKGHAARRKWHARINAARVDSPGSP